MESSLDLFCSIAVERKTTLQLTVVSSLPKVNQVFVHRQSRMSFHSFEDEANFEKQSRLSLLESQESAPDIDQHNYHPSADLDASDPFQPFQLPIEQQDNILSLRAVAVGLLCGGLVNASNIYLGLKSGWTAGANIFGVTRFACPSP